MFASSMFKKTIKVIARWQSTRTLWILVTLSAFFSLGISYFFFELYLYMQPCEQCVHIRFCMMSVAVAGIIATISPKNLISRIIAHTLSLYGTISGIFFSYKLNAIHKAIKQNNLIEAQQGCSNDSSLILNMPINEMSTIFKPSGKCGYDSPIVPTGAELDTIQQWLINFYANGWYLIPKYQFINMAQMCMIVFLIVLLTIIPVYAKK